MLALSDFFQRVSGRAAARATSAERRLLERAHARLVDALAFRDTAALEALLAADAELRSGRSAVGGRDRVAEAMLDQVEGRTLDVGATAVRVHGATAVVDAPWHLDAGGLAEQDLLRSCIFQVRRGAWQLVSVRDVNLGPPARLCAGFAGV